MINPVVVERGTYTCSVKVPLNYTDLETIQFANRSNPRNFGRGWYIIDDSDVVPNKESGFKTVTLNC